MRVPRALVALCLALSLPELAACSRGDRADDSDLAASLKKVSVEELEQMLASAKDDRLELHVFDANERAVWASGHVPSARWIAFNEVRAEDLPPNKDAALVFYCANED
jgi:hypothetical protein